MRWDDRGHFFEHSYDDLQRPLGIELTVSSTTKMILWMVYGDNIGLSNPEDDNLRGQVIRAFDQSGVVKNKEFDFKGNLLESERHFASNYKTVVNWDDVSAESSLSAMDSEADALLDSEGFTSQFQYDALNRPVNLIRPDSSEILPTYNQSGLLQKLEAKIRGAAATEIIEDITYNPRGQRKRIQYGNQAVTQYTYDTNTFRLVRLLTTRNSGNDKLQDLNYTFDPVGNIVAMEDQAQQTHYFQNSVVSPEGKYEYDSLYRLLKATGREHYGQGQIGESDFPINAPVPFNNGSNSVETYTEQYEYDDIGNILKLIHQAGSDNWTRGYHYGTANNRLLKTSLPGDTVSDPGTYSASYTHDAHGNMTSMPHLSDMKWSRSFGIADQLKEVDLGGGGKAYYVYSDGNRVRKVIENGNLTKERLYLDDINEYYREYFSGSKDFERETLHVMDDRKRLAIVETKTYENGSPVGTPSPVIRYNFDNHLGSSCLELDTSANIISYEEYHPFGTSSYRLGDSATEVSLKRYRYAGKERDEESGLYYYGARYYAPWLCRFVSVDPLKDDYPYLTDYNYAGNKPVTHKDIDGLQSTGDEPTSNSNPTTHTIEKGDTFWDLEETYNLTHGTLQKLNPGVDPKKLQIGTQINLIPTGGENLDLKLGSIGESGEGPDFQSRIGAQPQTGKGRSIMGGMQFAQTSALFGYMGRILKEGTLLQENAEVDLIMDHFRSNTGEDLKSPGLADLMTDTEPYSNMVDAVSSTFETKMQQAGGDYTKVQFSIEDEIPRPSFSFSDSPTLKTIVGGTQQLDITLDSIQVDPENRTYSGTLNLTLYDDFGVDERDVTNPSLAAMWGQNALGAFWVLQHQRGIKPFRNVFNFSIPVRGKF